MKSNEDYRRELMREAFEFERKQFIPKNHEREIQVVIEVKKAIEQTNILVKEKKEKFDKYTDAQKKDFFERAKKVQSLLMKFGDELDKIEGRPSFDSLINKLEKKKGEEPPVKTKQNCFKTGVKALKNAGNVLDVLHKETLISKNVKVTQFKKVFSKGF